MNILLAPVVYSVLITGQLGAIPPSLNSTEQDLRQPATRFNEMQAPVVGGVEHYGWGLAGTNGRHYFFGGIGFADYTLGGQRQVVSLREENGATLPDRDKFLYYREIGTGNRWAISKRALAGGTYETYYQLYQDARTAPVDGRAKWTFYQSSRLIEDSRSQQQRSSVPEQGMAGTGEFQPRQPAAGTSRPSAEFTQPALPRQNNPLQTIDPRYVPRQYAEGAPVHSQPFSQPAGRYVYVESGSCCGN